MLRRAVRAGLLSGALAFGPARTQASEPQPATRPAATTAPAATQPARRPPYTSRAPSTRRSPDIPDYVHSWADWVGAAPVAPAPPPGEWLLLGLEHRARFELRDDHYRAGLDSDSYFALRSRLYVGVREILDPLRLSFEFQDSRLFGGDFRETNGDVNEHDILQAYGELFFPDVAGPGQPLSFRVGRMSFDAIDRRLMSRNGFRNTTNAFQGFRLRLGEHTSPWELDLFALQPVERLFRRPDRGDEERWFYGLNGYWREWEPHVVLEPYYFVLDQDRKNADLPDRELHTFGLHAFGLIGGSGFDYDLNAAFQVGESGERDQRAFAVHAELGYTFDHAWKPRLAASLNYGSGDENPDDALAERFDTLFGSSHTFYGFTDNFEWSNTINPALQLTLRPSDRLRLDGFYRVYWLASDRDAFARAGLVSPKGRDGDFVGHEFDLAVSYALTDEIELETGYACFLPGDFVRSAGDSRVDDSELFYVQLTISR